jgi:transposase
VIATAIVAAVDDGRHFRSGRELAAWIGLVPQTANDPRRASRDQSVVKAR